MLEREEDCDEAPTTRNDLPITIVEQPASRNVHNQAVSRRGHGGVLIAFEMQWSIMATLLRWHMHSARTKTDAVEHK